MEREDIKKVKMPDIYPPEEGCYLRGKEKREGVSP